MSNLSLTHPYWNREEFLAFLMIYAANADMECTDEERRMIQAQIADDAYSIAETEYQRLTDYQRIQLIQSYRPQYFQNPEQKADLLKLLTKLFHADGEYDIMEHNLYLMLQKIL